jgi:hypothetical protein
VIASQLLYSGLFEDADKSLAYFASKRSYNNWGVTGPSQMRFVHYFNSILNKGVEPLSRPLKLSYIHLSAAPSFTSSFTLARAASCCPFIHIYHVSDGKRLIYSSENDGEELKYAYILSRINLQ